MKFLLTLIACLVLVVSCASKKAELYRMRMIGLTPKEVLQCAGAPLRSFDHGALTVFTYSLSTPPLGPGGPHTLCEASVIFEDEAVADITYRPREGAEYCEPIFRSCASATGLLG